MLRDVKPELGLGIGVIDIKDNEVETPEIVAHRIEQAAQGWVSRIPLCPPGLRVLDAVPQRGRRQDAGAGRGT